MINYTCNKCGAKKNLMRATIAVIDGKVRTKEAFCECGEWMQEEEKDFEGFPSLIRTDPSLSKNGVWTYLK